MPTDTRSWSGWLLYQIHGCIYIHPRSQQERKKIPSTASSPNRSLALDTCLSRNTSEVVDSNIIKTWKLDRPLQNGIVTHRIKSGWLKLWAIWSNERCPFPWQGSWNQVIFRGPLWVKPFCDNDLYSWASTSSEEIRITTDSARPIHACRRASFKTQYKISVF